MPDYRRAHVPGGSFFFTLVVNQRRPLFSQPAALALFGRRCAAVPIALATLEDEDDFERHFDYVHYNPVKHGHVRCPYQWPHSSFHRYVSLGVYDQRWGCWTEGRELMDFRDIEDTVGE